MPRKTTTRLLSNFPHPMVQKLSARETKILEKRASQDERNMTAAVHTMLREYAGNSWPAMNHKGRMAQLERKLGFGHRRVRSLYQNEPGVSVRAEEAARIAELVATREEAIREEDRALARRVASLERQLAGVMAALARDQMAAEGASAGATHRPPNSGGGAAPHRRSTD